MANIKLSLYKLIPTALLALIRHVIASLTGNLNFTNPKVKLLDMIALGNALEIAIEDATNGSREARILRDNLVFEAREMLKTQADYVRSECNGDKLKLASSGFELAKDSTPVGKVGIPENVRAFTGQAVGEVEFSWKSVHGAHGYDMWKAMVDDNGQLTWVSVGFTTRTRNFITGLDSHTLFAFRVNAVGVNGAGLVSATVQAVAA